MILLILKSQGYLYSLWGYEFFRDSIDKGWMLLILYFNDMFLQEQILSKIKIKEEELLLDWFVLFGFFVVCNSSVLDWDNIFMQVQEDNLVQVVNLLNNQLS